SPPSGIGTAAVFWIAVSPAYARTGLVIAQTGTSSKGLWVSHDGGASWIRPPATDWAGGRPVVGVDRGGKEALFAPSGQTLQRSDDSGATWRAVASGGYTAVPAPTYAVDGSVGVAGAKNEFILQGTATRPVAGSGGVYTDWSFAYSPQFPD